jgi:hypothetical protein
MAKSAREAMKAKAKRLGSDRPTEKVDSSSWTPPEMLNADVKTGLRPISRRQFKKGGKVMGTCSDARADRKPRKSGGKAITADSLINRNVKEANELREGKKHVGGMKKGGSVKRKKYATDGKVDEIGDLIENLPDTGNMPDVNTMVMRGKGSSQSGKVSPADAARMQQIMSKSARDSAAADNAAAEAEAFKARGYKKGGRTKKMVGGPQVGAAQMMQRAQATGDVPAATMNFARTAPSKFSKSLGMKKGGKAHPDEAADKALIKKMVKPSARTGKAYGGADLRDAANRGKNKQLPREEVEKMRDDAMRGYEQDMASDARKSGGKVKRKGRFLGGSDSAPSDSDLNAIVSANRRSMDEAKSGLMPKDSAKGTNYKDFMSGLRQKASDYGDENAVPNPERKAGGRTGRKGRKTGGGVFSGAGYPHKVPGVVPGGRDARKTGGRAKGKTDINIVIATGKGKGHEDMMPPGAMMGKPGAMPVPVPPPGGMPMPSAGAPAPAGIPMQMPPMPPAGGGMPPMGRKAGGRISKIASSYKDMTAGSGGGEGRLQKTDIAKRGERKAGGKVYKSYKDMDAGAASGLGRLEKTQIAARKS